MGGVRGSVIPEPGCNNQGGCLIMWRIISGPLSTGSELELHQAWEIRRPFRGH